jgi:hypothetical protein
LEVKGGALGLDVLDQRLAGRDFLELVGGTRASIEAPPREFLITPMGMPNESWICLPNTKPMAENSRAVSGVEVTQPLVSMVLAVDVILQDPPARWW